MKLSRNRVPYGSFKDLRREKGEQGIAMSTLGRPTAIEGRICGGEGLRLEGGGERN